MKFTRDQVVLYSTIAAAVALLTFFVLPVMKVPFMGGFAWIKFFSSNFFGVLVALIALLAPIYVVLYNYRDKEPLVGLKSIFACNRFVIGVIMVIAVLIQLIIILAEPFVKLDFGIFIYMLAAACICYLGSQEKD